MKPRRHLSSGSGSGSHDSHDSSDDNGNQRSYYSNSSYNMTFVACDLCYNGEYPPKPRKKVSSWPTVTCKDIYNDLQSLNKHANPTQCYTKANEYRVTCCSAATTARQSRSNSAFPHPKFSTVFGIFIIWFIVREYVKSRRRLLDGEDYDDSSIPPEEGADYKELGSVNGKGQGTPQKLMKLGSRSSRRKRSSSGRRGRNGRDDNDDDDSSSNASPVFSIIQMLISTPQHKKRKKRPQRGRSRRRSRSRSSSRSRSRGRRSKSRPIIRAEPDPPQMQLV